MNVLSNEKQAAILSALVEGNSIRATARMVGCSKNTVSRLLRIVGLECMDHHDRAVQDVETDQVQADEIWAFVGCKERQVPEEQKGRGRGDIWTFTAICRDSKLLIAYRVSNRTSEDALAFMDDLAARVANRIQLTTDSHRMYPMAIELV